MADLADCGKILLLETVSRRAKQFASYPGD